MEGGDLVVGGIGSSRIAAGLEHEHRVALFGETRGDRTAASAGPDDHIVGVGYRLLGKNLRARGAGHHQ